MRSVLTHTTSALIGVTTAALYFKLTSTPKEENSISDEDRLSNSTTTTAFKSNPSNYIVASKSHTSPTLPVAIFNPNPNLEIAFDTRTKNPLYVLERITKESLINTLNSRKGQRFTEEKSLLEHHRSRNSYYRKSGYDRGHLAPAADYPQQMDSTFTLCNVSPQISNFNRGIWSSLEDLIRKVSVEDDAETTYVVTGPLWLPSNIIKNNNDDSIKYQFQFEGIGTPPSIIYVPTHFFKVIVVTNNKGLVTKYAAFVLPNKEMKKDEYQKLRNFIVRITDIESVSGISFSPLLQLFSKSFNKEYSVEEMKDVIDSLTDAILLDNKRRIAMGGNDNALILFSNSGMKKLNRKKLKELNVYHLCDQKHDQNSRC